MIICFDLETTGLSKENDKIIEISMIKFDEKTFEQIDVFHSFVDPEIPIPELISNITQIFDSDVLGAPKIEDLTDEIEQFIGDTPLLGHNVFFDRDFFLANKIDISANRVLDTFFLANFLCYDSSSLNLEVLNKYYNIPFTGAHRAENDVKATIKLLEALLKNFQDLSHDQKLLLYYIFDASSDENIEYLKNLLFSSEYDISHNVFEDKILENIGKNNYNLDKENNTFEPIDISVDEIYNSLGDLEKRENQGAMTQKVFETLQNVTKTVIEAPTGLGKSFAYLIPSLSHSLKTGEKVFVTTKTKNLQDQLYSKDLAFLHNKVNVDFSYTKLKGKRNYISVEHFLNEIYLGDITYTKVSFYAKIILWLSHTEHGELDELNYFGQEFVFLKYINADNYINQSEKNRYYEYEYLVKARKAVAQSNIVVVNHSLLFSDIGGENNILGDIKNLIIDEAHNIEDSVTDALKERYNLKNFSDHLDTIESILTKKKLKKSQFLKQKEELYSKLDVLEDYAFSYINNQNISNQNYLTLLLKKDFFDEVDFSELIKKTELNILDIVDNLSSFSEYDFSKESKILLYYLDVIKVIFDKHNDNTYIKILSYNERSGISFDQTLLNPGNYLRKNIWNKVPSVVLTSATLQIGNKFDYIKNILDLEGFEFICFESDFDYSKQSTLFVPNDLGDIKNNSKEVISFLSDFYSAVRGKTLTLLTSFSMIRNIYTQLNNKLKKEDISLYAQSITGSKTKLMSFFLEDSSQSILLGTDSFWEGVDIPGEDLKFLVIHKFPFTVPTDPIFQARSIFFKDPFSQYSIPKAIIKLKQGFGRLIRSKSDTGVVILLDSRIYSNGWGSQFFHSFPADINIKHGSSSQFINILKNK